MWSRKIAKGVSDIMITMHKVSSSNVHSVGYDEINKNLYVKFLNNSTYIYYNVPERHYNGLLSASSVGRYLDTYIKKGNYRYKKL
ncbi:KTSC domain-containing protein [Fusobacterium mortiferum]|jgi:hypothetical protein|nr:KTSC domain-containing protein [Fusobacterium mortiferum]